MRERQGWSRAASAVPQASTRIAALGARQTLAWEGSVRGAPRERDYGKGAVSMLEGKRAQITKDFPYEYWIGVYKEKASAINY